ncbi:MAG: DUF1232 domain-containing protein [Tetrasphaera sp.]|nr:DUF1232 domain-containing protein [Tetrasphaera sp.]
MTRKTMTVRSLAAALRLATRPGGPSLAARAAALPRLLRATVAGQYPGTTLVRLLTLAAAIAYVVSPVDVLPEALLGPLGLADDAFVVTWLVRGLVEETEAFLEWERAAPTPASGPSSTSAPGASTPGPQTVKSHVVR